MRDGRDLGVCEGLVWSFGSLEEYGLGFGGFEVQVPMVNSNEECEWGI